MSYAFIDPQLIPLFLSVGLLRRAEPPHPDAEPRRSVLTEESSSRRRGYPDWVGYLPEIQKLVR